MRGAFGLSVSAARQAAVRKTLLVPMARPLAARSGSRTRSRARVAGSSHPRTNLLIVTAAVAIALSVCERDAPARTPHSARATPERVAVALGDSPGSSDPSPRAVLALPEAPDHLRTCCAFGMDLGADLVGVPVPFFEIGNVVAPGELGTHAYAEPEGTDPERNGLVYTCRGGWIDTAHVRENADREVFLASQFAHALARGTTITVTTDDAETSIFLSPVPDALVDREGPSRVAATLAAWVAFQIAVWHEVSTWFGYQTLPGFSEQVSAFSIEDLYSDALGIRLGAAAIEDPGLRDILAYERELDGLLEETLRELGARPLDQSRAIMGALDGRWWSSQRRLPDPDLVMRRAFPPTSDVIEPWRARDAFDLGEVPAVVQHACGDALPRPLVIADQLDGTSVRELVRVEWRPTAWADARLPFRDPSRRVVTDRDMPHLVAAAHDELGALLGPGFDAP